MLVSVSPFTGKPDVLTEVSVAGCTPLARKGNKQEVKPIPCFYRRGQNNGRRGGSCGGSEALQRKAEVRRDSNAALSGGELLCLGVDGVERCRWNGR
ncbi:hypothetical protein E2C01_086013 [Portunus trituberculatus]|uniref:Uncharacterized protein n=1 Tax=Portunus trituberculatus TaxID=210409 RepID=A0A5B7J8I9_PORTR|nr:hypothetical protein [Portunus trituberculatus]